MLPLQSLCWPAIRTSSSGQPGSVVSVHVLWFSACCSSTPRSWHGPIRRAREPRLVRGPGQAVRLMALPGGRPRRPRRGREWVRCPRAEGWAPQVYGPAAGGRLRGHCGGLRPGRIHRVPSSGGPRSAGPVGFQLPGIWGKWSDLGAAPEAKVGELETGLGAKRAAVDPQPELYQHLPLQGD